MINIEVYRKAHQMSWRPSIIPKIDMTRKFLFALLLFAPLSVPLPAAPSFSIGGYHKNFFVIFDPARLEKATILTCPDRPMGMVKNRLRLKLFYDPGERLSFSLAYDICPRIQDPLLFEKDMSIAEVDPLRYRVSDLRARLYPSRDEEAESFGIFQNLDRATMAMKTGPVDIFIGRQAIAWGSARVINPTDIIAPYTFEELDTEDRIGVDALRVRIPIGFMGELDMGYLLGQDLKFQESAGYLRGKFHALETDASFLLMAFRENLLVGLDVARSIGGAGFWLESGYVFAEALKNARTDNSNNYLRASIGLDYSLGGKTYGFIEYHFNDAGSQKAEEYLQILSKPAFTEGAVYLLGRHYLAPGVNYQVTPLSTFTGQALINIADPSMLFTPQVEYNIAQNIYLSAGAYIGVGKQPVQSRGDGPLPVMEFRSEFGGYADLYFSSFQIYF